MIITLFISLVYVILKIDPSYTTAIATSFLAFVTLIYVQLIAKQSEGSEKEHTFHNFFELMGIYERVLDRRNGMFKQVKGMDHVKKMIEKQDGIFDFFKKRLSGEMFNNKLHWEESELLEREIASLGILRAKASGLSLRDGKRRRDSLTKIFC